MRAPLARYVMTAALIAFALLVLAAAAAGAARDGGLVLIWMAVCALVSGLFVWAFMVLRDD